MPEQTDDGFIQLINQHMGIAYKVSNLYFTDVDVQKDVRQEMMYQLWKSYPSFDGRSKFSTWMYSVCLNTALTFRKKEDRHKDESLSISHHQIAEEPASNKEDVTRTVMDAVALLTPLNKAIVLLYLDDLSYEEIAAITGLTRSNVSVRLVRIKKELEVIIKKQSNEL
jgi:RNA polymerase sigma factor (sigma-70 family)